MWIGIPFCLFLFLIFYLFFKCFSKYILRTKYLEFDINNMTLNLIKIDLRKTKKVISYNLYEIKCFTHNFNDDTANFKIVYREKEEEIIKFFGNYPETYKTLENFFNEKLQKITKRYNSYNLY